MHKALERGVSDYLAVSRARDAYASDAEYEQAEARSWSVLVDALAGHGQEYAKAGVASTWGGKP